VFRTKRKNKQALGQIYVMSLAWFPFPCQRMATIEIGSNGCGTLPENVHNCASANKPGSPGAAAACALGTGSEMN